MERAIEFDGSIGEGGGQVVRTSLSLAMVTGRRVRLVNIRAGRRNPGLRQQHLTAIRAAQEISTAAVQGDAVGSRTLDFRPRELRAGAYAFSVGTAGSATLVLQTVLPGLLTAAGPSELTLRGGTHNPWAPPYDFLARCFFPLVGRMGPRIDCRLDRHGFYPAGGGEFRVRIHPSSELKALQLVDRGALRHQRACAVVANLPRHIAEREIRALAAKLDWPPESQRVVEPSNSRGPGNVVMIEVAHEHVTELFTGFGRRGVRAEHVANEAVQEARSYLATDVPVGPHLADQLLLPCAVAAHAYGQRSQFRTLPLTQHAATQQEILERVLGVSIHVEPEENGCLVRIGP